MEWFQQLVDLFLHLDQHLAELTAQYGATTYAILFGVIFCETGLVVTPFLPGDSLLFAAGAIAAPEGSALDVNWLFVLLSVAAILGDTVNYHIGQKFGRRAFAGGIRFLKREHLEKTQAFYEKHGAKTIVLARFVPIVRTFAPFVAGLGVMSYKRFLAYNIFGGVLWCGLFLYCGTWFGNQPVVKENFSLVILAIIVLSVLPMVIEIWKAKRAARVVNPPR